MHDQLVPKTTRLVENVQRFLSWTTAFYLIALVLLLAAMGWWGERSWVLSVCLYLPMQGWLLPLLVLTPACLLARPQLCLWHAAAAALVLTPFSVFRPVPPVIPAGPELRCVTNNVGDHNGFSVLPFLEAENPDLIALQDVHLERGEMTRAFAGRSISNVGQFMLISRFPIRRVEMLAKPLWRGDLIGCRHEIDFHGRPVAIYNLHLPTPRSDFMQLRGLLKMMVVSPKRILQDPFGWAGYPEKVEERIALIHELLAVLESEPLPFIALGDFNTPNRGYIYRLLTGKMTDCFARSGRGPGPTFPGDSPYPISFREPWLRLDYVFAGKGWEALECRTEPARRSQHRAVFARLSLASGTNERVKP